MRIGILARQETPANLGNAETTPAPGAAQFLPQGIFLSQADPAPTVPLYGIGVRANCQDGAVWFAGRLRPGPQLHIRKYDPAATLQRNLLVTLPPQPEGAYDCIDPASLVEQDGQFKFSLIVYAGGGKEPTLESFVVKF